MKNLLQDAAQAQGRNLWTRKKNPSRRGEREIVRESRLENIEEDGYETEKGIFEYKEEAGGEGQGKS